MTATNEHTPEYVENLERQVAAGQEYVDMNTHMVQERYALKQQLTECRAELRKLHHVYDYAIGKLNKAEAERDRLRDTHRQVLLWMRQTDSATPMADVIKLLDADLEEAK